MKKQELLNYIDDELLDKLFGFCYARTNDSYEAQELCSDIIFNLIKAAHADGDITSLYSFVWRVARNVYADFADKRRQQSDRFYEGDAKELLETVAATDIDEEADEDNELLRSVYRRIAFLTKAYREVMIMFYIDGLSTAEIAKHQNTSEGAVRQRLFSARQKIKSEVEKMTVETYNKPLALDKIDFVIWGTGNPRWNDPRNVCTRMFSNHIVWLCHKKPRSAAEIAEELNVPTVYVEEELEILAKGENGKYGLLRRMDNGKYAINFVLLDKDVIEKANALYTEQLPKICDIIADYIEVHKKDYLAFPYLNKKVDFNLILWQQIFAMSHIFADRVEEILADKYFSHAEKVERPFSVFGYVDNGKYYGAGWDGVAAQNICGFSEIHLDNIYIARIKKHFGCGHDVANDAQLQLALRAINGLNVAELSEKEKEHAAKAIEVGYLYREGDVIYTKILVNNACDNKKLFSISDGLKNGFFDKDAEAVAEKIAALINKAVPDYLIGEWEYANRLAGLPILDSVVEVLIEKGILTPPEDGIGAEGCWMNVAK
ncbi:MAG: RNA polymerase sigma factor [Lachnospiraceae bacterium]|nr:RNA polymerase sigma factor [Lachnospiraceae bacterium]